MLNNVYVSASTAESRSAGAEGLAVFLPARLSFLQPLRLAPHLALTAKDYGSW